MAPKVKRASDAPETPSERPWWTSRECWTYFGISRQRWQRIVAEQKLTPRDDDGIQRYDPELIEELGERLGLPATIDPSIGALQILRETLESMGEVLKNEREENRRYVDLVQSSERETVKMLREENTSLREMRAKEQEAYLRSLEATQEALDHTAERKALVQQQIALSERQDLALGFFMTEIAPKIVAGFASKEKAIILDLIASLDDEKIALVKELVTEEQFEAIQSLRKANKREESKSGTAS